MTNSTEFRISTFCRKSLLLSLGLVILVLSGCGKDSIRNAVTKSLEAVGLKDPPPETERRTQLRLYAGQNLNAGSGTQATATVVKIYQLRNAQRFEDAPYDLFLDENRERLVLGQDLINVTEVVLMPEEQREIEQVMPIQAQALGIVTLFRAPAANRWRFVFDMNTKSLATEGITIGLHACAMTSSSPGLVSKLPNSVLSTLGNVRCSDAP